MRLLSRIRGLNRSCPSIGFSRNSLCSPRYFSSTPNASHSPILSSLQSATPADPAIIDSAGVQTYNSLLTRSTDLAGRLQRSQPVALFLQPDSSFVTSILATWLVSAPAVPLSPLYPAAALAPLVEAVAPSAIISSTNLRYGLPSTNTPILALDPETSLSNTVDPSVYGSILPMESPQPCSKPSDPALIFFTSGTTGKPKGVVWTHDMLDFQLQTLSSVWRWCSSDRILNVLPLHHIHGLVNVVLSALFNKVVLEMHSAFDAHSVWSAFTRDDRSTRPTIFMAVPGIYQKLLEYYNSASTTDQRRMSDAVSSMRLFISGSAALRRSDSDAWLQISGHRILERYGMTETGMTLSNPYDDRYPGMLGTPLPGVSVKLDAEPVGQLLVKGRGVFSEYWNQPQVTESAFTTDHYFMTGDIVERDPETGHFRLLGRANADFINSGGYKVSSLEIEDIIRDVPGITDCCVVGLPDDVLGERIVAAVTTESMDESLERDLREKVGDSLPRYKAPRQFFVVESFPRNVLGKVQKQLLRSRLQLIGSSLELRGASAGYGHISPN